MKIISSIRAFLTGSAFLLLTGCAATLNFRQGVTLRNPTTFNRGDLGESDFPKAYGIDGLISFEPARIDIRLDRLQKNFILAVGPDLYIPFPIIPWPVGIVKALLSPKASATSNDDLKIIVRFGWNLRDAGPYVFDPKGIKIVSDGTDYFPTSFHVKCDKGCEAGGGSYEDNGKELKVWTSRRIPQPGPEIEFEFPIAYDKISTAQLTMIPIKTPEGVLQLPPTAILNKSHVLIESLFLSP